MSERHPTAKQIRDTFERPTMWPKPDQEAAAVVSVLAAPIQPERKAA